MLRDLLMYAYSGISVKEYAEIFASGLLTQLSEGFRLDLADTLSGNVKLLSDFFKGVGTVAANSIAEL